MVFKLHDLKGINYYVTILASKVFLHGSLQDLTLNVKKTSLEVVIILILLGPVLSLKCSKQIKSRRAGLWNKD